MTSFRIFTYERIIWMGEEITLLLAHILLLVLREEVSPRVRPTFITVNRQFLAARAIRTSAQRRYLPHRYSTRYLFRNFVRTVFRSGSTFLTVLATAHCLMKMICLRQTLSFNFFQSLCRFTSASLHFLFTSYFGFLLYDAVHCYGYITGVLSKSGFLPLVVAVVALLGDLFLALVFDCP